MLVVLFFVFVLHCDGFLHLGCTRLMKDSCYVSGVGSLKAQSLDTMASAVLPVFQKTLLMADTSISEEDVMAVTGSTSDLPNPLWAVGFAFALLAGVAILQFSLGDLTKEEGQARVRDYLQTKNDTERKRGYFD